MMQRLLRALGLGRREPEILVLGDSHTRIFKEPDVQALFPGCRFRVVMVGGATASGLANPNSQTQAYPIFKGVIEKSRASLAIVQLGEVDAGFVIWYRSQRHNLPVRDMLKQAVDNYCGFLSEVAAVMPAFCVSAPLPTIADDNDWGEVANARRDVKASQVARTEMTLEFNRHVGAYCRARHIRYIDLDGCCLADDGLVKKSLLNPDDADHHYDHAAYAALLGEHLAPPVIEALNRR